MKPLIGTLIKQSGYRKNYIADQMNTAPSQLSAWIAGRATPPLIKARRLARILGVQIDDLYDWGDE